MDKKAADGAKGRKAGWGTGCCQVEAVTTMDERGQLVLPKAVREKAGIKAGDKLAVVSWERDGKTCCIALIRAEGLAGMVKGFLGPVMGDILGK
jgi:AbrB family looped-hinge helix DNA binding protein